MTRKKHRDDGSEKTQEELDEEEMQLKLQSENMARRGEDGFTAPSVDAPQMDERTFARTAGLPHEDFEEKDWKKNPAANCPTCGFKFTGCHDTHTLVKLVRQIILNGKELGPGEVIVPSEAEALWSKGL